MNLVQCGRVRLSLSAHAMETGQTQSTLLISRNEESIDNGKIERRGWQCQMIRFKGSNADDVVGLGCMKIQHYHAHWLLERINSANTPRQIEHI